VADGRNYPIVNNTDKGGPFILDCGDNAFETLTVNITSPTTDLTYTWTLPTGAKAGDPAEINKRQIKVFNLGEYSLLTRDSKSGCQTRVTVEVTPGKLTPDFSPMVSRGFAPLTVQFTNNSKTTEGTAGIINTWNFGNGATYNSTLTLPVTNTVAPGTFTNTTGVPVASSPSTTYHQPGTYSVTLYASKGSCLEKITKLIIVDLPSELTIPNVFTPNNDGINDVYHVKSTNLTEITMTIFDRWGHLVYDVTSATGNVAWDGMTQYGTEAAEGTYFYVIKATGTDGEAYDEKGSLQLFR
jgi:gliding motility-associated-like protein